MTCLGGLGGGSIGVDEGAVLLSVLLGFGVVRVVGQEEQRHGWRRT